jgi:hypothetical protein
MANPSAKFDPGASGISAKLDVLPMNAWAVVPVAAVPVIWPELLSPNALVIVIPGGGALTGAIEYKIGPADINFATQIDTNITLLHAIRI